MIGTIRLGLLALAGLLAAAPASAHPHVWITMNTELIYAPDGSVTGIRHHWVFDDMYSAFALQGLEGKEKGKFTREELSELAKVNIESLNEYGYFTVATADGIKSALNPPASDYWLDYKDEVLTLHFTLPIKAPVKARELKVEVYDPTFFISFELAKETPVRLVNAPAQCKLDIQPPRKLSFWEEKKLAEESADSPDNLGAAFANKILVTCL
jgi:ABC-type uncharacterized transport system substrate-binding protein